MNQRIPENEVATFREALAETIEFYQKSQDHAAGHHIDTKNFVENRLKTLALLDRPEHGSKEYQMVDRVYTATFVSGTLNDSCRRLMFVASTQDNMASFVRFVCWRMSGITASQATFYQGLPPEEDIAFTQLVSAPIRDRLLKEQALEETGLLHMDVFLEHQIY